MVQHLSHSWTMIVESCNGTTGWAACGLLLLSNLLGLPSFLYLFPLITCFFCLMSRGFKIIHLSFPENLSFSLLIQSPSHLKRGWQLQGFSRKAMIPPKQTPTHLILKSSLVITNLISPSKGGWVGAWSSPRYLNFLFKVRYLNWFSCIRVSSAQGQNG